MNREYQQFIQNIKPHTYRLFKHFLVENHILSEYHSNFLSKNGKSWRDCVRDGHYCKDPLKLIEQAFPTFLYPLDMVQWGRMTNRWRKCYSTSEHPQ